MRRVPTVLLLAAASVAGVPAAAAAAKAPQVPGTYTRVVPSAAKYAEYSLSGTWTLKLTAKRYLYEKSAGDVLGGTPQPVTYASKRTKVSFTDRQEPTSSPCRRATYRMTRVSTGVRFKVVSDKCAPRRLLLQSGVWKLKR